MKATDTQIIRTGNEYEVVDCSNSESPNWPAQDSGAAIAGRGAGSRINIPAGRPLGGAAHVRRLCA